ncbi:tyrosine--tRNA ligase, mitochondrial [Palaemon carinicauda]|uniref:tyrosine--tRNA ligase, mitochondrial n=1 Tax=Palaemon carinicauda TaxID=392227 RepID=UPI0035B5B451
MSSMSYTTRLVIYLRQSPHMLSRGLNLLDKRCYMTYNTLKACNRSYSTRNILKLHERGLWADRFPDANTNDFIKELNSSPQTIYSGFDPTADSLHVGNLLVLVTLLHCQRAGHNIITLVGGATAQVGDPSGRSSERPLLRSEEVCSNAYAIAETIRKIFKNHNEIFWDEEKESLPQLRIVDNSEWYNKLNVVDFLRIVGRNLRLGEMMSRTSVQSRLNSNEGISFTEFTYQALQAYDWLYLYDNYQCTIQIGGSDQMGNLVSGHDLISRARKKQVTGLTVPLITNESGNKFGKTAGNAVWLDSNKTSAFDFYQFFIRTADADVEKYLKLLTFNHLSDIENIMKQHWIDPEKRLAQKKLAENVTLLVHGKSGLDLARFATDALYGGNPEGLIKMTAEEIKAVFKSAASASLILHPGTSVLKMAMDAGCFIDERDARRIIKAGGFYINLARVNNPDLVLIPTAHILPNNISLLRVGKKNYYLVKWLM